jgi:DNA (cytosine-5)-methyltransferase 1
MPNKPYKAIDLFCKAGGVSMGLHRAGFDVTGVDIEPQPKYPFRFIQADAFNFDLSGYDAIFASPVCKGYSQLRQCRKSENRIYPDQIAPLRERLRRVGAPYVIENVNDAPLVNAVMLCGAMFNLKVYRHRWFESNIALLAQHHYPHRDQTPKAGSGRISPKGFISVAGNCPNIAYCRQAMGIDWMGQKELSQAIPPAYSEYLGQQVIAYLDRLNEIAA